MTKLKFEVFSGKMKLNPTTEIWLKEALIMPILMFITD